ncbi:MAG: hypothetical protein M1827_001771 [Pycnora praestabilis]|nr:MAG: hypothetical protein M1827_001771 [Pycnora praestabilis]
MTPPSSNSQASSAAQYLLDPKASRRSAHGIPSLHISSPINPSSDSPKALSEPRVLSSSSRISSSSSSHYLTTVGDAAHSNFNSKGPVQSRKKKASNINGDVPRASIPRFDPRALLSPKDFNKRPRSEDKNEEVALPDQQHSAHALLNPRNASQIPPPTNGVGNGEGQDVDNHGMGSYIERMHNVSKREDRLLKKQKLDQSSEDWEEDRKKAAFSGGGKNGVIGQYMREEKEKGRKEAGSVSDDDDLVVISDSSEKEVCYGRIEGARVQSHLVPAPSTTSTTLDPGMWPVIKVALHRRPGNTHIISVTDPRGNDFGNVDFRVSLGLAPLMDAVNVVRTQARLSMRQRKLGEAPGQQVSDYYDVIINLYGKQKDATKLGRFLSQKQIWLRTPLLVDPGIETCNPHAPRAGVLPRTGLSGSIGSGSGSGYVTRTVEEIRSDVISMFDSLEKSENLPELEPDPRILTPLLNHQKQGLYFMTDREKERVFSEKEEDDSSLWRLKLRPNGQRMYFNVITGKEERSKPPEVLGGILADMMGLGKTLSILSLVVSTLDQSEAWAEGKSPPPQSPEEVPLLRNSKTTLLVSPLSTIANWEEQIKAHVKEDSLSYYIYHGTNRRNDANELAKYDIVITTYNVVSSEFDKRSKKRGISPLVQTNWFRIVLDEAHMIREQSTRQSKAICALSAQRRWAVTGTPVQNRLDDLGALIKFLRIKPFDEKGGFTQFILSPFKNADPEILPKLRLLVDSITLRRLKDRIDLPPRHDQIVKLEFNDEERCLYDWFAKDSDSKMRAVTSDRKNLGGKAYVHILRAILRLRLICAHGKELLGEEDLKMTEGFSRTNAIDLEDEDDEKPALTSKQVYDMFNLMKETGTDHCSQCNNKIGPKETISEDASTGKDEVIGFMTPCYQILCRDCIKSFKELVEQRVTSDNHAVCPLCEQYIRVSFFEIKQGKVEEDEEARIMAKDNPKFVKKIGRYGGPHTKTKALLAALFQSEAESDAIPEERPIKRLVKIDCGVCVCVFFADGYSVIFSGWTSHLDLIQIALDENKICYVRLDGKMSRVQRTASLDAFRDDPSVTVILVSIMAGGLGLNLTTGSKVYVMEPQFNPAAEAQAIDRIHRLGQTREVTTTRFIMDNSFEEKMLELQRKKQKLADLSMNRGRLDKNEIAKRRMEDLRSLFK